MNLKIRLKQIRENKGLTQKQVREVLGYKKTTFSHYETQDYIIPIEHLNELNDYYNTSIDFCLGLTELSNYKESRHGEINLQLSGTRLKEIRKESKTTQDWLSQKINVNRTLITKYERGQYPISTSCLFDICKIYGVSADWLLGKIDHPKKINDPIKSPIKLKYE